LLAALSAARNFKIFPATRLKAEDKNIYARVIALPHFGHFMSKHGIPIWCAAFSPQLGQTQEPPGPAP
jgi:hypothetical protein